MEKKDPPSGGRLHLRRLIDRWTPRSFMTLCYLKGLQFLRFLGVSAEKHGWRKVASIFVRNEYSKFMLAVFRLQYSRTVSLSGGLEAANCLLLRKLAVFIELRPELHWSVKIGKFSFSPYKNLYRDVIEAHTDGSGNLTKLIAHFDPKHPPLLSTSKEQLKFLMHEVIEVSNAYRYKPALQRMQLIRKTLLRRITMGSSTNFLHRHRAGELVDRIMSAVFVYCEVLPESRDQLMRKRYLMPDIHRFRHPGWGLVCIVARFSHDLKEVDLWWHFNHVVVDGAPMQEMLDDLKKQWGTCGPVVYPDLNSPQAHPETMYCGDDVFRTRIFIDFSRLLTIRKKLNERFQKRMKGKANLGIMMMWCLAQQKFFSDKKMLMPVDVGPMDGARELGILVIRPEKYRKVNTLRGFLRFQEEVNMRMDGIRSGRTESHEFLALCSMMHPFLYHVAAKIIFPTLNDIVGTVGLSVLRDAEMFISPMTDMQVDGFISLGCASIPTEDGRRAGALCFSGNREHTADFLEAAGFLRTPESCFSPERRSLEEGPSAPEGSSAEKVLKASRQAED